MLLGYFIQGCRYVILTACDMLYLYHDALLDAGPVMIICLICICMPKALMRAEGVHIRQTTSGHGITVMYYSHSLW